MLPEVTHPERTKAQLTSLEIVDFSISGRRPWEDVMDPWIHGVLPWAPNMDPNTYQLYGTIYHIQNKGHIEQTPPESKRPTTSADMKTHGVDVCQKVEEFWPNSLRRSDWCRTRCRRSYLEDQLT